MSNEEKQRYMERIDEALNDVRPHLAVDGGDVELADLTSEMVVKIKWMGACEGCSMSLMTMRAGIEQAIISRVPEVRGVVAINGLGITA